MRRAARNGTSDPSSYRVKNESRILLKDSDDPKGLRNSTRHPHGHIFRPGDVILESGIYEVIHDQSHRNSHEVVMIAKDPFPACDTCLDRVRFRLVRTAPYIFQDLDFEAPEG